MTVAAEILRLLEEKKQLLLQIEQITLAMKEAPASELMELFTSRGVLLEKAQALGAEISLLAGDDEGLKAAISSSASPDSLSGELKELFEASLRAKAVANRIAREDEAVLSHVQNERDGLLQRIEGLNTSGASVASSYLRSVQTGFPQSPLQRKPKMI